MAEDYSDNLDAERSAASESKENGELTKEETVTIVNALREDSYRVRRERIAKNKAAWDIVNGELDFSDKTPGQSKLVLPDLQRGLEQASALLERELTTNTSWFSIDPMDDVPQEIADADSLTRLLRFMLRNLHQPGYFVQGARTFEGVLADALKIGMVEGEVVLKVVPVTSTRKVFRSVPVPPPTDESSDIPSHTLPHRRVETKEVRTMRLSVTVIPYEDFFPDPSGFNSWVIHEYDARVCDLEANPAFDKETLAALKGRVAQRDEKALKEARENQTTVLPQTVGTVRVREFFGDLIGADGEVRGKNVLCVVAENECLKKAEPTPFASGAFPFVRGQLRRAPLGEVHPAFVDLALDPYLGEVQMYNLLLDHAKSSVGGVYQLRPDMLQNEADIAKGIPPGFRARLKRDAGAGKFMERCDDTNAPQHAQLMLSKLGQSREVALAVPDLNLGPQGGEKLATEIITTEEGKATFFETTANRLEEGVVEPFLKLSMFHTLQYLDDFSDPDIVRLLGAERAVLLKELEPAERFELLSGAVNFKATGLREMTGRIRELRKWITSINLIMAHPALAHVYDANFSFKRTINFIMRSLGVDVTVIEKRADEPLELDPRLLAAQAGTGGSIPNPDTNSLQQTLLPPNPEGERGSSQLI